MNSIKGLFRPFFSAVRDRAIMLRWQRGSVLVRWSETVLQERKTRLLAITAIVNGRALRLNHHLRAARTDAEIDHLQADLYSLLAVQGGERYAQGVLDGTVEPRPAAPDLVDPGFIKLDQALARAHQFESSSVNAKNDN